MSQGRAYLSSPDQKLYMVLLEVTRTPDSIMKNTIQYYGPYGTLGAAKGKRTTEVNYWSRSGSTVSVSGVVFECQPEWKEVK